MGRSATTVGHDLVFLPGFREQLADPASTFVERTFTPGERRASELRARARATSNHAGVPAAARAVGGEASEASEGQPIDGTPHLAARFAAKEAFLKAWDQCFWGDAPPIAAHDIDYRDIEVVSDAWSRPALRFHGAIATHIGERYLAELSLSHDGPFASAVVILHEERS